MDDLRRLAEQASKLASQGKATPYDVLNMHSSPSRQSTSFFQISENESVEVIGHRLAPHAQAPEPVHTPAPAKRTVPAKRPKGKDKSAAYALPPPAAPALPKNWQDLSKPRLPDLDPAKAAAATAAPQFDDWYLIRTRDGKVGWVLSRMLMMSIPDEVAQYAEGHRITAYLSLGEIKDKEKTVRHNWLWTTSSGGMHPYEFDSFRVFVWSTKRHHYETAYIERNVQGFYPIQVESVPGQEENSFSVVIREKDGKLYKKTYGFSGYHVRMISKSPSITIADLPDVRPTRSFDPSPSQQQEPEGVSEKIKSLWKRLTGR
jgi:hypothetical protein